jgi:hypothetical protein
MWKPQIWAVLHEKLCNPRVVRKNICWPRFDFSEHSRMEIFDGVRHPVMFSYLRTSINPMDCLAAMPASTASALRSLDLSELTPYAVETRDDAEFWPDRAPAEGALRSADQILELISGFLAQQ